MATKRKPFQGVTNIVKFNWQFYLLGLVVFGGLLLIASKLPSDFRLVLYVISVLALLGLLISLSVSWWIYDYSNLYSLDWLRVRGDYRNQLHVNIHAGYDEISPLLIEKLPQLRLQMFDFYDPIHHTEPSIRRARKLYPSLPGTVSIQTNQIPLVDESVDYAYLLMAAHEIRDRSERRTFFSELHRSLKQNGEIVLVEHLRDAANFLAFNIGFLHFFSKADWEEIFSDTGFRIKARTRITPFLTLYTLAKNDHSL